MSISFRMATASDAAKLLEIYSPYVTETCISFEKQVPSIDEFQNRITETLEKFPYIVCLSNQEIIGYAYAHSYRSRSAYDWGAELSIYMDKNIHGRGIGKTLYLVLIELLKKMNYQTVYGVVTSPNPKSEKLHQNLGFENCGIIKKCGYKLGQWIDITNFELEIGDFPANPQKPANINTISNETIEKIFADAANYLNHKT